MHLKWGRPQTSDHHGIVDVAVLARAEVRTLPPTEGRCSTHPVAYACDAASSVRQDGGSQGPCSSSSLWLISYQRFEGWIAVRRSAIDIADKYARQSRDVHQSLGVHLWTYKEDSFACPFHSRRTVSARTHGLQPLPRHICGQDGSGAAAVPNTARRDS